MKKPVVIIIGIVTILLLPILFTKDIASNYGDVYRYYYPFKHFAKECIINGELPLWNPYIFTGVPFLATPQSAIFYPFSIVSYIFPLIPSMNWFYWIHLVLAGLFMFLFIKKMFNNTSTSLFASITFMLSPLLVLKINAGHPALLSGWIWAPLILLFASELGKESYKKYWMLIVSALTLSLCFLSGHTQSFYLILFLVVLYTLFSKPKALTKLFLACILTAFIAMVQIIPTLEFTANSQRGESATWGYEQSASYSLPPKNLLTLLSPNVFGNIKDKTFVDMGHPSSFFETYCNFFGVIPLILFFVGCYYVFKDKSREVKWIVICIISLILSFGLYTPIYQYIYKLIPGLNLFRAPARFYFITLVTLIIIACYGWNKIMVLFSKTKSWLPVLLIFAVSVRLISWDKKFIETDSVKTYLSKPVLINYLQREVKDNNLSPYRIVTDETIANPNKSMMYHLLNINGCEVIIPKDFVDYTTGSGSVEWTTIDMNILNYSAPELANLGNKWTITQKELGNKKLVLTYYDTKVYLNENPPPWFVINYPTKNVYPDIIYRSNKFIIKPDFFENGSLRLTGFYYPGWVLVSNDKKEVIHANNNLQYTYSWGGKLKNLVLVYTPASFKIGLYISLITLISIILAIIKLNKIIV